jgi:diguanylate cyclase (GGDEF)-like protein
VPVELMLAVLAASAVANAALLMWLARADHVTVHWPFVRPEAAVPEWQEQTSREASTGRRRSLFVAGPSETPGASRSSIAPGPARIPDVSSLPPDLAALLKTPAPLGPQPAPGPLAEGFRILPPEGALIKVRSGGLSASGSGIAPDGLTGLEDQRSWTRIVEVENARLMRYRRPSTVVVAELDGLRRLAERLGDEPVARLLPVVADAFRAEARDSDWVARIGYGRFAAFLAETDEIAAINYVERIRQICEPWLASSAVPLRLAIGWSSPSGASDIELAIKRAEERMHADRRLPAKLPAPRAAGPGVVALPDGQPAAPEIADPTVVSPAGPGSPEREHEAEPEHRADPLA